MSRRGQHAELDREIVGQPLAADVQRQAPGAGEAAAFRVLPLPTAPIVSEDHGGGPWAPVAGSGRGWGLAGGVRRVARGLGANFMSAGSMRRSTRRLSRGRGDWARTAAWRTTRRPRRHRRRRRTSRPRRPRRGPALWPLANHHLQIRTETQQRRQPRPRLSQLAPDRLDGNWSINARGGGLWPPVVRVVRVLGVGERE